MLLLLLLNLWLEVVIHSWRWFNLTNDWLLNCACLHTIVISWWRLSSKSTKVICCHHKVLLNAHKHWLLCLLTLNRLFALNLLSLRAISLGIYHLICGTSTHVSDISVTLITWCCGNHARLALNSLLLLHHLLLLLLLLLIHLLLLLVWGFLYCI